MSQQSIVQIGSDTTTPSMKAIYDSLTGARRRDLLTFVANRANRRLKRHFLERDSGDSKRRRRGWPQRHFWATVERATQIANITEDIATITVASAPFAFKVKGGTITPKRSRHLALPLRGEAYGKGSPREWGSSELVPVRSKSGNLFLAQVLGSSTRGSPGTRGIRAQYLLVRSVTQIADPNALPPQAEMSNEIEAASQDYLKKMLAPAAQR